MQVSARLAEGVVGALIMYRSLDCIFYAESASLSCWSWHPTQLDAPAPEPRRAEYEK